ncbi:hypothetical protein GO285_01415 [Ralstonia solanacearum]|nr:hypothetical protein [Ralstonia solanacearum]NKG09620.1 hypothetical protein [Ralstonia solanacearum]
MSIVSRRLRPGEVNARTTAARVTTLLVFLLILNVRSPRFPKSARHSRLSSVSNPHLSRKAMILMAPFREFQPRSPDGNPRHRSPLGRRRSPALRPHSTDRHPPRDRNECGATERLQEVRTPHAVRLVGGRSAATRASSDAMLPIAIGRDNFQLWKPAPAKRARANWPTKSVAGNSIPTCQHQHGDEQGARRDPPVFRHGLAIRQSGLVGIGREVLWREVLQQIPGSKVESGDTAAAENADNKNRFVK